MVKFRRLLLASLIVASVTATPSLGWHHEGHHLIAVTATRVLPEVVPAFFRDGAATIGHLTADPDLGRHRLLAQLREAESPEHYLDLELLRGEPLPADRNAYHRLMDRLDVDPTRAGFLPYAVAEWTQRLAMAFAEHRRWPDNPHIQQKCLIYAGLLAHYAGDLQQPLHTTIHYNGRVGADGRSPRTGIHSKVDDLLFRYSPDDLAVAPGEIGIEGDLFDTIVSELRRSHTLVDRVYALEPKLPDVKAPGEPDPAVAAFALERGRAAARFTASLFLAAWELSEAVDVPRYLDRNEMDQPQR